MLYLLFVGHCRQKTPLCGKKTIAGATARTLSTHEIPGSFAQKSNGRSRDRTASFAFCKYCLTFLSQNDSILYEKNRAFCMLLLSHSARSAWVEIYSTLFPPCPAASHSARSAWIQTAIVRSNSIDALTIFIIHNASAHAKNNCVPVNKQWYSPRTEEMHNG